MSHRTFIRSDGPSSNSIPGANGGKKSALFLCTHNSSRSQMAAALLNRLHGGAWEATSAGTDPRGVHPEAVAVMAEIGIDISGNSSRHVDSLRGKRFDLVVTVCDSAHESCPVFPGKTKMMHQGFPDPSAATGTPEERLASFRLVRDQIRAWLNEDPVFLPIKSPVTGAG
ncbi:MAG TPA: arsenate reductase ArsC [Syntrophales bacterium]|nr:arsenate reductase ArsC [Syntrophales bacterium]